jgi:hypothetical protein
MALAGDFNSDRQSSDPMCTERRGSAYCEGIIHERGLVIGNDDRPTEYWMSNESVGVSITELTLANRPFGKLTMLDGNHATGSDHEIIECEVVIEKQEEAGDTLVVGWNLAAMSQEAMAQAEKLWTEQARGRAYMGVESTGDNIESQAAW